MRRMRQAFSVALLGFVALLAAPGAAAEPIGDVAAWTADWWQAATTWISERLPTPTRTAASTVADPLPSEEPGGDEDEPVLVLTSSDGGPQTESGPHWDPDG